jgi:PAS domain S-box-containing protein
MDTISYQPDHIAALQRENEALSQQVKRLIKAEAKLYEFQETLDAQLNEYAGLYELNKKLNKVFDFQDVFACAVTYVINNLGYQRVLLFRQADNSGSYTVFAIDGYYGQGEKDTVMALSIPREDPLLTSLREGPGYLICTETCERGLLAEYRSRLGMNEYLVFQLGSGPQPLALLVAGNSGEDLRFYRRVEEGEGALLGIGNFAELISSSLENKFYYAKMKHALEQESLAKAKYRSIFEKSLDGIYRSTPEGRFISCNPATAAILGYDSPEEVIETIHDIAEQHYVYPHCRKELLAVLVSGQNVKNYETEFYRKDGSVMWALVSLHPTFDDKGQLLYLDGIMQDTTERKRMEAELRKAQKLESLGVLAGGIAHDFNNLLSGILGNISLAKTMTDPKVKSFKRLDEAENAVFRARDLTKQLMTFSKGGSPVKNTAAIDQIVKDSALFVLRGSNVRCTFEIGEGVWPVEVDEGQMNQVINNLIINADQAMEEGGIIEVGIKNMPVAPRNEMSLKAGRYVQITIRDHGTGIPEQYLHKIFDPYFTTKEKGSGLGLASVYSIIRNHGGCIGVESKVGAGTTFRIYIPASENGLMEVMEKRENLQAGSGKILVMDDEEIIREVTATMLEHLGYSAVVCCDGSEAIELYRQAMASEEPFNAVIMDLTIPGAMGGKEAVQELHAIDREVIGIVSSGYCNDPILSNYREYGFRGMVGKPYSLEELGNVLHELLSNA